MFPVFPNIINYTKITPKFTIFKISGSVTSRREDAQLNEQFDATPCHVGSRSNFLQHDNLSLGKEAAVTFLKSQGRIQCYVI